MSSQMRIDRSTGFMKDVKRAYKRGMDLAKLDALLDLLAEGAPLPLRYRAHRLANMDCWECHVSPDWLLVYETYPDRIVLRQLGTHSDIFG